MFIDMNSFFASCEQQVNYYLRGRPVGICAYTGKHGAVIAASIEAKQKGVTTGMRLSDAIKVCPDLVPIETNPNRYRDFHTKIISVLQKYSPDVIPKSIDEAAIDLTNYKLIYKSIADLETLALQIKADIKEKVGDWLKCSIGIAPNAFLAKLGSDLKKPDGMVVIVPENIDSVLLSLKLTDLPGIAYGMEERLLKGGIRTPYELRHAKPDYLQAVCKSIVGYHWHQRLNFKDVENDTAQGKYKSMQAMRQISADKRKSIDNLTNLFVSLCMTLEKRMVGMNVYAHDISFFTKYEAYEWKDHVHVDRPIQDGQHVMTIIRERMRLYETKNGSGPILNTNIRAMGVSVSNFVDQELLQYHLFEDTVRKDQLRKVVYNVKSIFGNEKLMRAMELHGSPVLKDAIGFGSIKDLQKKNTDDQDEKHYDEMDF
jgi:DNA polymerase-4